MFDINWTRVAPGEYAGQILGGKQSIGTHFRVTKEQPPYGGTTWTLDDLREGHPVPVLAYDGRVRQFTTLADAKYEARRIVLAERALEADRERKLAAIKEHALTPEQEEKARREVWHALEAAYNKRVEFEGALREAARTRYVFERNAVDVVYAAYYADLCADLYIWSQVQDTQTGVEYTLGLALYEARQRLMQDLLNERPLSRSTSVSSNFFDDIERAAKQEFLKRFDPEGYGYSSVLR